MQANHPCIQLPDRKGTRLMEDKPPKRTAGDTVYAVVKAGISAVPAVGGAAAELLGLALAPRSKKDVLSGSSPLPRAIETSRG